MSTGQSLSNNQYQGELQKYLLSDTAFVHLKSCLDEKSAPVGVFSASEGARAELVSRLAIGKSVIYITSGELEAIKLHTQLLSYCDALLYPPRELPLVHIQAVSVERRAQRLAVLSRLALGVPCCIVACAAAVMDVLCPRDEFLKSQLRLKVGDAWDMQHLLALLCDSGYERVAMLEGAGQCAMRGDIIDIFPPQSQNPVRIEFFGDEIDQIRIFDAQTQLSIEQTSQCILPPAYETVQPRELTQRVLSTLRTAVGFGSQLEAWSVGRSCVGADVLIPLLYSKKETVLDYLPPDAYILINEPDRVIDSIKSKENLFLQSVSAMLQRGEGLSLQAELIATTAELILKLDSQRTAAFYTLFRPSTQLHHRSQVRCSSQNAPLYMGDINELSKELYRLKSNGEAVIIFAGDNRDSLFEQLSSPTLDCAKADRLTRPPQRGEVLILSDKLPCGFCYPELHLTVLSGAELFSKQSAAPKRHKRSTLHYTDLKVGDYVVHEAHGIGKFVGVEQLTVQGVTRDYLLFSYRGDDKLYIPTDQLDRIQKYIGGGEDYTPPLSKLGSGDWQGRVNRARQGAKKLAIDLAQLYEKRSRLRGFAFSKDGDWQKRLEQNFPYDETADQLKAIQDIKADMEASRPMDRLLCGDVGYGKTEVALRAAFKAVQDSKQVAILVPTTILAQQHYSTLQARFLDYPVRLRVLSRFQSQKERDLIKKQLATGQIDIVVGTHALLANDVRFKDLGLLIIDEEHRFGVNHKEKIKSLKGEVDVLTLSATPIPRTLNLSMTGIVDISTIDTPPENRYPVQTFVMEFSDALCRDALSRELARGGQAFVVSNNVMGMESTVSWLNQLLPEARVDMAHGQMSESRLEGAMERFLKHESDILVCSTIVESGVDFANANTLIVLDADRFGLAQLYQLRGRVGRSSRLGYAYFTVQQSKQLSEVAQKRLMAIREFTQFGAGYRLALRDLEIRGAGTLLGAEQHGHISDIGYDYYCKLIKREVNAVRGISETVPIEATVDIPLDAFIPRDFLPSELLRLSMYRQIAGITSKQEHDSLLDEFFDRYGDLPAQVLNLMQLSLIKALAARAAVCNVSVKNGVATLQFDQSATPDGARLLLLLGQYQGARLSSMEPVKLQIIKKGAAVEDYLTILPQLLTGLVDCNLDKDGL